MTLEHYPGMTEKMLREIEAEANERWDLEASLIVHRYGRLEPGDRIVLVATASAHRQEAFDACAFLIDWLKTKAPFWKLEESDQLGAQWVVEGNGRSSGRTLENATIGMRLSRWAPLSIFGPIANSENAWKKPRRRKRTARSTVALRRK